VFLGVCCRLSGRGVEQILELDLTADEQRALQAAADLVHQNVARAKAILATAL
jgi:malate/lactate dehydrogenase